MVEKVVALAQVVVIRHLRDQIGRAQQVADDALAIATYLDPLQRHFIAGEVHQLGGGAGLGGKADRGQERLQEVGAAAHVEQGEGRAVADVFFIAPTDIAGIMEQRQDHAEAHAPCAQAALGDLAGVMAVHQAHHRQRAIQAVLRVVVPGVTADVTGQAAREQFSEGVESRLQRFQIRIRIAPRDDRATGLADLARIGDVDRIGHIKAGPSVTHSASDEQRQIGRPV